MRRLGILLLAVVAACTGSADSTTTEAAPATTTSTTSTTTTSTTTTSTTTTTLPPTTTTTLAALQGLTYVQVATASIPVQMVPHTATSSLVATKDGRVWAFDGSQVSTAPVLDLNKRVRNDGEQGLLAIAVHPDDPGRLFVHYTANDGDTVVEEYALGTEVDHPDASSQLLQLFQPARNHNGGMIQFGPDGGLYLGLGDGGGSNDRFRNGQDQDSLLGGVVRLDVDGGSEPQLFQYGLRNPWRFWIDGDLIYVADVGQNRFEEVTVAPLVAGVNYGWSITEGLHCFRPSSDCDTTGQTLPVVEVPHSDAGTCSITGGIVYRGPVTELQGRYFYSDYCGGYLRSFVYSGGEATDPIDWTDQVGRAGSVIGFGVDHLGSMYVLTRTAILRVDPIR